MPSSKSKTSLQKIGLFCSGGDAPGMNAAIRAVTRTALFRGLKVIAFYHGYRGILESEFVELQASSVANILQRGGTILKTSRLPEFHKPETRTKAAQTLKAQGIDGLVCIGGNGSFTGAHLLAKEHGVQIIGVPATIDNDIWGTEHTIGFDTAINTALEAIDRIRDTAASHDRLFIVEVMGRDTGFIAAAVGLAGGAEEIFFPDHVISIDEVVQHIKRGMKRNKTSSILVTAEGQKPGRAYDLAESLRKKSGLEAKVCILGHIQRGGTPTARDRIIASRLGAAAVDALIEGKTDVMVGIQGGQIGFTPLVKAALEKKKIAPELIRLVQVLSS